MNVMLRPTPERQFGDELGQLRIRARRRQRPVLDVPVHVEAVDPSPLGQTRPAQRRNAIESRHRSGMPIGVGNPVYDMGTTVAGPLEAEDGTDLPRVVLVLRQEEHQVEHPYRDTHGLPTFFWQFAPRGPVLWIRDIGSRALGRPRPRPAALQVHAQSVAARRGYRLTP